MGNRALLKAVTTQIAKMQATIVAKMNQTPKFAERAGIGDSVPGLPSRRQS